ncbi:hypothetical protein CHUAL_005234 [Chamberlinius hualienensis]
MDVVKGLKSIILPSSPLIIDNTVFRLHYRFTVVGLFAFSTVVTCRQYIGNPIQCTVPTSNLRDAVVDEYCWVSSTVSLPKAFNKKVGTEVIYPGVDKQLPDDDVVRHQYYQWVCFVLLIQGIMFYFPHYVWKQWESRRLRSLCADLANPTCSEEVKTTQIKALSCYFYNSLFHHEFYGWRYCFCEFLNFINVIGQMFLTNAFLGGTFLNYGAQVLQFTQMDQSERTDPMIQVFPRVTKCAFYTYGPTGDAQLHDAICVLPINIINEKIYIIIWFWFVCLAIVSGFALVYRAAVLVSWKFRYYLLKMKASSVSAALVEEITRDINYGDWFLLYLISKNINSYTFRDVADVVRKQIRQSKETNPRSDNNEEKELV